MDVSRTNTWEGGDPDDVSGYLVDYIHTWLDKKKLLDVNAEIYEERIYEMEDDDKVDFIINCLQAIKAQNA